jgi:hypothetical protein
VKTDRKRKAARCRRIAEVTRPFERSTSVCYWYAAEFSRQTLTVFKLLALSHFNKMDRERKSAVGGATNRKKYHYSVGQPKMVFCVVMFYRPTATVCEFLSILWFSTFRPAVVLGTRGRGKPEVTSPFDSRPHFCISGLLTSFVYLFPQKS